MRLFEVKSKKPIKAMLLGDTHLCPSGSIEDMDVLRAAGERACEEEVDHVFHIGDLGDFRSVNKFKGGTLMGGDGSDEGHDLLDDIQIWRQGLRALRKPFDLQAERLDRQGNSHLVHHCEFHIPFGNHEDMVFRPARRYVCLKSVWKLEELNLYGIAEEEGWNPYPFLSTVDANGLLLTHYVPGLNPKTALGLPSIQTKNSMSTAVGHTHERNSRSWQNGRYKMQTILNTGCTKHPSRLKRHEDSGVFIIEGLMDGEYSARWIPTAQLLADYYRKNGRLAA